MEILSCVRTDPSFVPQAVLLPVRASAGEVVVVDEGVECVHEAAESDKEEHTDAGGQEGAVGLSQGDESVGDGVSCGEPSGRACVRHEGGDNEQAEPAGAVLERLDLPPQTERSVCSPRAQE